MVHETYKGKIYITATLTVLTGMHIGDGGDYAPIGAVDSPFIRDPFTHAPIIPGSSLKGKIRTLLAKYSKQANVFGEADQDSIVIKRLFGASKFESNNPKAARLQFFDLFVTKETKNFFSQLETDTYIGEVKFENTISRITGVAKPRQIERVPAGAKFDFRLVYNVEKRGKDDEELKEDLKTLAYGFELLSHDYLGGHGSRGYGRVALSDFKVKCVGVEIEGIEHYLFGEKKML